MEIVAELCEEIVAKVVKLAVGEPDVGVSAPTCHPLDGRPTGALQVNLHRLLGHIFPSVAQSVRKTIRSVRSDHN